MPRPLHRRCFQAGEELFEDYSRYCGAGEDCDSGPDFISDAGDYLDEDDGEEEGDDRRRHRHRHRHRSLLLSAPWAAADGAASTAAASTRVSRRSLSNAFLAAAPSSVPVIPPKPGSSASHHGKEGEEHHHPLVQLPGVHISRSAVPGAVGGLGLFAAAGLPAGTVWNKADAETSLVITR
jgi:hypothetical protein